MGFTSMNDAKNFFELAAYLATIFSLLLLSRQLYLLRKQMKKDSLRSLTSLEHTIWATPLSNIKEYERVLGIVFTKTEFFSPHEVLLLTSLFTYYEFLYIEFINGDLDATQWDVMKEFFMSLLKNEEIKKIWNERIDYYHPEYVKFVMANI